VSISWDVSDWIIYYVYLITISHFEDIGSDVSLCEGSAIPLKEDSN